MSKLLLHPSLQHILRFIVDQSTFGGRSKGDAASKSHYAAPLVPARAGEWQCVRITDGPQQDNQFRALAQLHSVLVFLFQVLASHTLVCIFVCPAACGSSHHHMIWRIHLIFFSSIGSLRIFHSCQPKIFRSGTLLLLLSELTADYLFATWPISYLAVGCRTLRHSTLRTFASEWFLSF